MQCTYAHMYCKWCTLWNCGWDEVKKISHRNAKQKKEENAKQKVWLVFLCGWAFIEDAFLIWKFKNHIEKIYILDLSLLDSIQFILIRWSCSVLFNSLEIRSKTEKKCRSGNIHWKGETAQRKAWNGMECNWAWNTV